MIDPMVQIVGVMLVAGVFGGLVNFYLSKPDDVPPPSITRSVIVGTAASFLVPLFLNMISSDLIDLIKGGDAFKLLILLGFCLVAAISSTSFIRTISDRVLAEAKEAKAAAQTASAQVAQVEQEIQPIVAKETEQDSPSVIREESLAGAPLTLDQRILQALVDGKYALRSENGLAREIGVDRAEVAAALASLKSRKLVDSRQARGSEQGIRWSITEDGRATIKNV